MQTFLNSVNTKFSLKALQKVKKIRANEQSKLKLLLLQICKSALLDLITDKVIIIIVVAKRMSRARV